jgi:endonuclease-8
VVQFDGPVLELLTDSRTRFDQRLAGLGPDILAPEFEYERFLSRLRADDYTRGIGDALLDQRNVAGIGNLWKSEGCWDAGVDPWRRLSQVSDEEAVAIIDVLRPRMFESARTGDQSAGRRVFRRHGEPCSRCGTRIRARGQGDDNRTTFWCPGCQR